MLGHMPQRDAIRSGDPQRRLRMLDIPLVSRDCQRISALELARDALLQPLVSRHGGVRRVGVHFSMIRSSAEKTRKGKSG